MKGNGDAKPRTVKLSASMTVGRAPECELRMDDTYASQQHARLFAKNDSWFVEDLGSTNGTFVNDQKLAAPAMLSPATRVRVGQTVLELRRRVRIEVGSATDIGRVRERNEDSILRRGRPAVRRGRRDGRPPGRRGRLAGRARDDGGARRRGAGSLAEHVRARTAPSGTGSVEDERLAGMGTTLTGGPGRRRQRAIAHVGDSRAYLLREGMLRQLTTDHTLVERMVRSGEITEAEADVHPHKNVLTRALGTDEHVEVDEDAVELIDGDRLLLCSDGLTGMVTEDQIQAILEADRVPAAGRRPPREGRQPRRRHRQHLGRRPRRDRRGRRRGPSRPARRRAPRHGPWRGGGSAPASRC